VSLIGFLYSPEFLAPDLKRSQGNNKRGEKQAGEKDGRVPKNPASWSALQVRAMIPGPKT
jgi:hypothetical protein